jgi:glycosyltransferase involved in cell wall biosynthesis
MVHRDEIQSMRVAIVSAVYPPEPVISARTSGEIAQNLTLDSHSILVLAPYPNRPQGRIYPSYHRNLFSRETAPEGYSIIRLFSFFSPYSTLFSRLLENISFGITSSWALFFSPRPDVVYSNSWPVFATGFICLVCQIRKIPLILSIQDMYPESMVLQGRLQPDHWLFKLLLLIDRWIARRASALIVISNSFAEGYIQLRQIHPSKVHVIPNWIDAALVVPLDKNAYRQERGISPGAFVFVYGGNVGMAAGVETVIDAIRKVNSNHEIILVITGSGSQLAACQKLAAGITNVRILFHSPWASEDTSKVLAAADILVLPTRGKQSLASVPSKLLSYMLAARPILAIVLPESETAQVIQTVNCGWIVPPDKIDMLATKVEEITDIPMHMLKKMGSAGRQYALRNFTTEICLPKVIEVIKNTACF